MEILFFIFMQWILGSRYAATEDRQLNATKFVVVASPLTLNCSPWTKNLSAQDLIWKHNHKAWLTDRTRTLNGSRTVQLYIPKVSFADSGTYQCCVYPYDQLGHSDCTEPVVVSVGEKPDISGIRAHFSISVIGFPPQYINITWPTISRRGKHDNGKPWKYEIYYRIVLNSQICNHNNVKDVASWCTRYSSSTKKMFSCNFTKAFKGNSDNDLILCCSVAVTNDYGTKAFRIPLVFRDFQNSAICTKPRRIKLEPSGPKALKVSFDPPLHMPPFEDLLYSITYCNLGSRLRPQFQLLKPTSPCLTMKGTSTTQTIFSLQDFTVYSVSVTCRLEFNKFLPDGLVAGPVFATTQEAAPDGVPHIQRTDSSETCTTNNRTVLIFWKLPPRSSWNGRPRNFVLQYWQPNDLNGTKMSVVIHWNISLFASDTEMSTNLTLPCFSDSKVQIKMCTVQCGRWSSTQLVNSCNSTLNPVKKKVALSWKIITAISVGTVTAIACLVVVVYFLHRIRPPSSESSSPLFPRVDSIFPMSQPETTDETDFTDSEPYDDFTVANQTGSGIRPL